MKVNLWKQKFGMHDEHFKQGLICSIWLLPCDNNCFSGISESTPGSHSESKTGIHLTSFVFFFKFKHILNAEKGLGISYFNIINALSLNFF